MTIRICNDNVQKIPGLWDTPGSEGRLVPIIENEDEISLPFTMSLSNPLQCFSVFVIFSQLDWGLEFVNEVGNLTSTRKVY